jgi:predicted RNase H-like HicB family nuclease
MQYTYTVILRREPEGGYTVLVPALRGCVTWGRNVVHSLEMAKEAIECYLESLVKHGEEIPEEGPVISFEREDLDEGLLFRVNATLEQETAAYA